MSAELRKTTSPPTSEKQLDEDVPLEFKKPHHKGHNREDRSHKTTRTKSIVIGVMFVIFIIAIVLVAYFNAKTRTEEIRNAKGITFREVYSSIGIFWILVAFWLSLVYVEKM